MSAYLVGGVRFNARHHARCCSAAADRSPHIARGWVQLQHAVGDSRVHCPAAAVPVQFQADLSAAANASSWRGKGLQCRES